MMLFVRGGQKVSGEINRQGPNDLQAIFTEQPDSAAKTESSSSNDPACSVA